MIADFGTKPLVTIVHRRFKYWTSGAIFLPKEGTLHYDLLQMKYYECSFVDIISDLRKHDVDS